jgi:hypothetical protein
MHGLALAASLGESHGFRDEAVVEHDVGPHVHL